jgi:hypothetical protein
MQAFANRINGQGNLSKTFSLIAVLLMLAKHLQGND